VSALPIARIYDPFLSFGVGAVNAVSLSDIVSAIAFAVALVLVLMIPARWFGPAGRVTKGFMAVAMCLYLFVGVSNTLQWAKITGALDPAEDYMEILFVPMIAYVVYSLAASQRLRAVEDAEERIRAEHELLESILETSPSGIMVIDGEGLVSFANDGARDVLQLEETDDSGHYRIPESVTMGAEPGQSRRASEALSELANQGPARSVVRFVQTQGERPTAIEISAQPLTGQTGETVVSFLDVTDRMRYRRDLERAVDMRTRELLEVNEQLREANNTKQDFLAKMSHELRTPLNSIIGFTGVLLSGKAGEVTEEQAKQLNMVRRSGQSLLQLVNDVLDISVAAAGRLSRDSDEVDVCAFLESAIGTMRPAADDHEVSLSYRCAEDARTIETDEDKLGQIVRNLLSNAIKFTDPGGSVTVNAFADGDRVVVEVTDTGIGITEADLPRVFEAFEQIETPDRPKPPGTGLGLAICRDLALLLDGDVQARSVFGEGSTFSLSLPRPKAGE
jgi:signal transduction histidine kinase